MREQLLSLSRVHAGYGDMQILEDVSMVLPAGGATALLGRNGVGKSTLLKTIMGQTSFGSGSILFGGVEVSGRASHERARDGLGFVPQEREIFRSLTVTENLQVAQMPGLWDVDRIWDLFPRLHARKRNYGDQLSGGEQQMLAMGRALMLNPKLLLLDEPFEGLAPIIVETIANAFTRLRNESGIAILLVEQHAALALELTHDAMVLDRGHVTWSGSSRELEENPEKLTSLIGLGESH
ncbi:MAG: ABC transporter ATP-binding protein [Pseudomonas sp.]